MPYFYFHPSSSCHYTHFDMFYEHGQEGDIDRIFTKGSSSTRSSAIPRYNGACQNDPRLHQQQPPLSFPFNLLIWAPNRLFRRIQA